VLEVGGVVAELFEKRDDLVFGPGALREVVEGEEEFEVQLVGGLEGEVEGALVVGVLRRDVEGEGVDLDFLGQPDVVFPVGELKLGEVANLSPWLVRKKARDG
jgi:hypothetical protein